MPTDQFNWDAFPAVAGSSPATATNPPAPAPANIPAGGGDFDWSKFPTSGQAPAASVNANEPVTSPSVVEQQEGAQEGSGFNWSSFPAADQPQSSAKGGFDWNKFPAAGQKPAAATGGFDWSAFPAADENPVNGSPAEQATNFVKGLATIPTGKEGGWESALKSAWNWINEPLVTPEMVGLNPQGWTGELENLAFGFTSPLNLAFMIGTLGSGTLWETAGSAALKGMGLGADEIAGIAKGAQAFTRARYLGKSLEEANEAVKAVDVAPELVQRGANLLRQSGLGLDSLLTKQGLIEGGGSAALRYVGLTEKTARSAAKTAEALVNGGFTVQNVMAGLHASSALLDSLKEGDYDTAKTLLVDTLAGTGFGVLGAHQLKHDVMPVVSEGMFRFGFKIKPSEEVQTLRNFTGAAQADIEQANRQAVLTREDLREHYPTVANDPIALQAVFNLVEAGTLPPLLKDAEVKLYTDRTGLSEEQLRNVGNLPSGELKARLSTTESRLQHLREAGVAETDPTFMKVAAQRDLYSTLVNHDAEHGLSEKIAVTLIDRLDAIVHAAGRQEEFNIEPEQPTKGVTRWRPYTASEFSEASRQDSVITPDDYLAKHGVDPTRLDPDRVNVAREELQQQMKAGQIEPLEIIQNQDGQVTSFETLDDAYRAAAAKQLGIKELPASIWTNLETDEMQRRRGIHEAVNQRLLQQKYTPKEIDNLLDSYQRALHPTPEMISLAREIRRGFDATWDAAHQNHIIEGYVQNYISHMWKEDADNPAAQRLVHDARSFHTNVQAGLKRVFENAFEGQVFGRKLAVTDPIDLLAYQQAVVGEAIAARSFLDRLRGFEIDENGKQVRNRPVSASDHRPIVAMAGSGNYVAGENGENPAIYALPNTVRNIKIPKAEIAHLQQTGEFDHLISSRAIMRVGEEPESVAVVLGDGKGPYAKVKEFYDGIMNAGFSREEAYATLALLHARAEALNLPLEQYLTDRFLGPISTEYRRGAPLQSELFQGAKGALSGEGQTLGQPEGRKGWINGDKVHLAKGRELHDEVAQRLGFGSSEDALTSGMVRFDASGPRVSFAVNRLTPNLREVLRRALEDKFPDAQIVFIEGHAPESGFSSFTREEALQALREGRALKPTSGTNFYQDDWLRNKKGLASFENLQAGAKAIVRVVKGKGDVSTLVHELGHVFRREITGTDLATLEVWADVKNGAWTPEAEEKFARGFEKYLYEGKAPVPALNGIFTRFKNWLSSIYKTLRGSDIAIDIPESVRKVYDRLLASNEDVDALLKAGREPQYVWNTQDFREIDHPAFNVWNFAVAAPGAPPVFVKTKMLVHPEAYEYLKRFVGADKSHLAEIKPLHKLLRLSTESKHLMLSLSPFHAVQLSLRGIMSGVKLRTILEGLSGHAPNWDLRTDPALRTLVENSLTVGSRFNHPAMFQEGLIGGSKVLGKVPVIRGIQNWLQQMTFERLMPMLKVEAAKRLYVENLKLMGVRVTPEGLPRFLGDGRLDLDLNPKFEKFRADYAQQHEDMRGLRPDQMAARAAARETNERFGNLNYKDLGRSAGATDFARLTTLAPDWLASELYSLKRLFDPTSGKIMRRDVVRFTAGMFMASRILNMLLTGKPHLEAPFGVITRDKEGRDKVWSVRTLPTDFVHVASDPWGFMIGRASPLLRSTARAINPRDIYGLRLTGMQRVLDSIHDLATPIPVQALGKSLLGELQSPVGNVGQIAKASGLTVWPYRTEAQRIAGELSSDRSPSGPVASSELRRHQAKIQTENLIRSGEVPISVLNDLVRAGQLSSQEAKQMARLISETRGMDAGMARLYLAASRLPLKDFVTVFEAETPKEKVALLPLLKVKRAHYLKSMKTMTVAQRHQDPVLQWIRKNYPWERQQ